MRHTGIDQTSVLARDVPRDVVLAEGPDAVEYLHGQLSQDVTDLAVGVSRLSFLLQPQGKVDALLRITRVGEDRFVLDTDAGHGETMVASLARFKLRTRIEFTPVAWSMLVVVGDDARSVAERATGVEVTADSLLGEVGVDLLGPAPALDGVDELPADAYERLRIAAGFPRMGVDLDEGSIPNESGLVEQAVSFTKGCYRGQELVERIHARGGNRQLLRVVSAPADVPPGAVLRAGEREVGRVTSVAPGDPLLALAYVRGDVAADATITAEWDGVGGRRASVPVEVA